MGGLGGIWTEYRWNWVEHGKNMDAYEGIRVEYGWSMVEYAWNMVEY